jgi:hypothetical protein
MTKEAIVVLTFKSIDTLLRQGGTSSWKLDRTRARRCAYAVCTRNAEDPRVEGPEPHHTGFLVGKVLDVVPTPDRDGRFLLQFSEYALINEDEVWQGDRNPVRYAKVEDLKIDFDALDWQPMPSMPTGMAEATVDSPIAPPSAVGVHPLTMAEAKRGLALTFGVAPEAIEITVRG